MSTQPSTYHFFVGVDIAKDSATIAVLPHSKLLTTPFTIDQDCAGFAKLRLRLAKLSPDPARFLVVLEATSTYWIRLANDLHAAGYHVSVVNPKQAHHFAQATLQAAKTDPLDAAMLAQLGAKLNPPRWSPPPAVYHQYQQRLAQREDILQLKNATTNQYQALLHEQVVVSAVTERQLALIKLFDEQLEQIKQELAQIVAADEEWGSSIVLLQSIPGIGLMSAAWLVVATLNFSSCADAAAVSAYLGLAPSVRQSGTSVRGRGRLKKVGNGAVRRVLYMASLQAAVLNPTLKSFYERLLAKGKSKTAAHCAVARKLVHLAYALVRKGKAYDLNYYSNSEQLTVCS